MSLPLPEDIQNRLIEEARSGSEAAFTQLQEAYSGAINYFVGRSYELKPDVVDDISQEVWIEVWKTLHKYNIEKGRFYTFVRTIARNKVSLHFREKNRIQPDLQMTRPDTFNQEFLNKLLYLTFESGGYPHQLIAFGFSKLIYTSERPQGTKGDAHRTAALFKELLSELNQQLRQAYLEKSNLKESEINRAFSPLLQKLTLTLNRLIDRKADNSTWSLVEARGLLDEEAGRTRLSDYSSSGDYERDVTLWSYSVLKRVRRIAIPVLNSNIRVYE